MGNCFERKVHPQEELPAHYSVPMRKSPGRKIVGKDEEKMMMQLRSCVFAEDELSYEIRYSNGRTLSNLPARLKKIMDEHYIDLLRSFDKEDAAEKRRDEIIAFRIQKARKMEEKRQKVQERRYCSGKVRVYGQPEYNEAGVDQRRQKLEELAARTRQARQAKRS